MCTLEKHGDVFVLTLTGSSDVDEHRFGPPAIDSILSAIAKAKAEATPGSALITTSHGKFFSNGLDLAWAQAAGSRAGARERLLYMVESFRPVVAAMMDLPMPTVAAVNGHAAAAGFTLALSHDYVIMRRDKGVLYMSEVDIGATLPDYFTALFRAKVGSATARRDVLLRAKKIKGEEALRMGLVQAAYDSEEQVAEASMRLAKQMAGRKWAGEVYAERVLLFTPGQTPGQIPKLMQTTSFRVFFFLLSSTSKRRRLSPSSLSSFLLLKLNYAENRVSAAGAAF